VSARAQGENLRFLTTPQPAYVFGERMTFTVSVASPSPITEITLFTRATVAPPAQWQAQFTPGDTVTASVTLTLELSTFQPFGPVDFWWVVRNQTGETLTAAAQTFDYADDRFAWQSQSSGVLTVHWYQGDADFGRQALAVATTALTEATREIRVALPTALNVYIYADVGAAQAALQRVGRAWAAGHAEPSLGVVIVVAQPGLNADTTLGRSIPHEITHILLYHATGDHYDQLPAWLNEGLATANQAQTDPDFPAVLAAARAENAFFALEALCAPFPADPTQATLAYAQSESVVQYLRATYGAEGIFRLIAAYAAGEACDGGVQRALGLNLPSLEEAWAQSQHPTTISTHWGLLAPWAILLAFIAFLPAVFVALTRPRT
jgi:hypothetical protein